MAIRCPWQKGALEKCHGAHGKKVHDNPERNPSRAARCFIMMNHYGSSWWVSMTQHDESSRFIVMNHMMCIIMMHHDDSSWWLSMMSHHESSWWTIVIHHDESLHNGDSSRWIMMMVMLCLLSSALFMACVFLGGETIGMTCQNQHKSLLATDSPDLGGVSRGTACSPFDLIWSNGRSPCFRFWRQKRAIWVTYCKTMQPQMYDTVLTCTCICTCTCMYM